MLLDDNDVTQAINTIVVTAAYNVAARYKGYAERPDVEQEMWIWCITHPDKISDWIEVEEKHEQRAGEAALRLTLRRVGEQYARQQKAALAGYSTVDEFFYDVSMIEELLPEAFGDSDGWAPAVADDVQGTRNPKLKNEGNDHWAKVADAQAALKKLPRMEWVMLAMRYSSGMTYREMAEELDISKSKAQRDCERALGRVVEELGGRSPWTTKERVYRRAVVSNAQAIAALEGT